MMLLFSPCKRCPCPCSDAVVLPPSGLRGFVRSGCAGAVGAAVRGRAGRGGGVRGPRELRAYMLTPVPLTDHALVTVYSWQVTRLRYFFKHTAHDDNL